MKTKILLSASLIGSLLISKAQYVDGYLTGTPTYTTIGTASDGLSYPRDLDFMPNTNDLWVVNREATPADGGSTVRFKNPGTQTQTKEYIHDSYANHFIRYPSAIACGANGYFANSNETNNSGNYFAGPALWDTDPAIYGVVHQNDSYLGSHIDMLHQSSFAMGIAHDNNNVYWVYDSNAGNICKYDFHTPHAPGGDDHSDGEIWRYTQVTVFANGGAPTGIPSHLVLDKVTSTLYIVDSGNKRVLKLSTKTGTVAGNLSESSEIIAGYYEVKGATSSVYINSGLNQPCGIDYITGRLIVSDHANGNILIYNTTGSSPVLMGTIATGATEIMGVKIGPDGKIWYVDMAKNKVVRIDANPTSTGVQRLLVNNDMVVYPNPTADSKFTINYQLTKSEKVTITVCDVQGRMVETIASEGKFGDNLVEVAGQPYAPGIYLIRLTVGDESYFKKLSVL